MVVRHSRWSGSGRDTIPAVRKWSGDPPGGPEVVGRPSRRIQNWSGDPPGGPEVVCRPARRSGSGRETLPEV